MSWQIVSPSTMQAILSSVEATLACPEWPFGVLSEEEITATEAPSERFEAGIYGRDGSWHDGAVSTLSLVA